MFTNVGSKIKTLAKVECWLGIILSVVFAFIQMFGLGGGAAVVSGLLTIGIGSLFSWIGSICLYGFGQLIDNSDVRTQICLEQNSQHSARES